MIVSIMQPYFLPYIGYFQLIAASDIFVVYDDVQYIKGGWINRNRILLNGAPHWLTLPVEHSPLDTAIKDKRYRLDADERRRLSGLLHAAYAKAPNRAAALPLLEGVLAFPDAGVAGFNEAALRRVCEALDIRTPLLRASELDRDRSLRGQAAVVDLARRLGATGYLNSPGGAGLYQPEAFSAAGISLRFIAPRPEPYLQFGAVRATNLSIADALMFCDAAGLKQRLYAYDILKPEAAAARLSA